MSYFALFKHWSHTETTNGILNKAIQAFLFVPITNCLSKYDVKHILPSTLSCLTLLKKCFVYFWQNLAVISIKLHLKIKRLTSCITNGHMVNNLLVYRSVHVDDVITERGMNRKINVWFSNYLTAPFFSVLYPCHVIVVLRSSLAVLAGPNLHVWRCLWLDYSSMILND